MLRAARVSILLTVFSDSEKALRVVLGDDRALSELPLVPLARSEARHHRQRAGIEGHASNGAADRLAEAGRRRLMVPDRAAALISCAQPILPEPESCSVALAPTKTGQSLARKIQRNT